jgi:hypothetical protein
VDSFVRVVVVVVVVVDIADSFVVVDGDAARTRGKWEEEKVVRKQVRKAHAQLRSFKKNQRAFKKKRRCARARATKERERERERKQSHSPSWEDSPPRRATLRRSCLPLWKVSFKNADFLKKKTSHPPSFEPSTERPQKKKKEKNNFHLSLLCVRTKTKSRPLRSDIPFIHSSIQERDWVRYIFRQKFGQRQIEREKDLFFLVVLVHISTTRKKTEEEKRDLRSESLKI